MTTELTNSSIKLIKDAAKRMGKEYQRTVSIFNSVYAIHRHTATLQREIERQEMVNLLRDEINKRIEIERWLDTVLLPYLEAVHRLPTSEESLEDNTSVPNVPDIEPHPLLTNKQQRAVLSICKSFCRQDAITLLEKTMPPAEARYDLELLLDIWEDFKSLSRDIPLEDILEALQKTKTFWDEDSAPDEQLMKNIPYIYDYLSLCKTYSPRPVDAFVCGPDRITDIKNIKKFEERYVGWFEDRAEFAIAIYQGKHKGTPDELLGCVNWSRYFDKHLEPKGYRFVNEAGFQPCTSEFCKCCERDDKDAEMPGDNHGSGYTAPLPPSTLADGTVLPVRAGQLPG